jgi:hypothetical protein
MKRPDQDELEKYARDYKEIDPKLQDFCNRNNFDLEINAFRQPCRLLRRKGNPHFLIDISLSGYWREIPFEKNMPHSITAIAYYEPETGQFVWKLARELASKIPFSILEEKLDEYLEKACAEINQLTPTLIMEHGERMENLKRIYNVS